MTAGIDELKSKIRDAVRDDYGIEDACVLVTSGVSGGLLTAFMSVLNPGDEAMKVVLHVCCGVCAAGVAGRLIAEGHEVSGFFYNPNVHPLEEFQRRLGAARRVAREFGFALDVAPNRPEEWHREADSLADEPEGCRRCEVCFRLRLQETYLHMLHRGADAFTTTLTVGPRKSADVVNRVGLEVGGASFLARDFKKKAGFQRAIEFAKQWGLYRQDYCGCVYSMRTG